MNRRDAIGSGSPSDERPSKRLAARPRRRPAWAISRPPNLQKNPAVSVRGRVVTSVSRRPRALPGRGSVVPLAARRYDACCGGNASGAASCPAASVGLRRCWTAVEAARSRVD